MLCKLPRHPLWAIRPHVNPASDEAREKGMLCKKPNTYMQILPMHTRGKHPGCQGIGGRRHGWQASIIIMLSQAHVFGLQGLSMALDR